MRARIVYKNGVRFPMVLGPIWAAIDASASAYGDSGREEMVVTSIFDGKHSRNSLHWSGAAVDLRTVAAGIEEEEAQDIAQLIRSYLPDNEFDVIVEDDHIHIEWQPKR